MQTITDQELPAYIRRVAEGAISKEEFYKIFTPWRLETKHQLVDIIFREVESYWADLSARNIFLLRTGAPKNIIEQDRQRLRILVRPLRKAGMRNAPKRKSKNTEPGPSDITVSA